MKQKQQYSFEVLADHGPRAELRRCQWPGCTVDGEHRAPLARDRLTEFNWYCLEHVRIYNKSWNYYEGLSDGEVEALVRSDTTWNRPSWPFSGVPDEGRRDKGMDYYFSRIYDPFEFFKSEAADGSGRAHSPSGLSSAERAALKRLDLDFPVTREEVKSRYKTLVKKHHPDANGGNKTAEEKFKRINEAYEILINGLPA